MPQNESSPPIGQMTWGRAAPVLVICVIFDAMRMFFEWFWFLGPAVAGVVCSIWLNGHLQTWTAGLLGAKTAVAVCGAGATVVGYFASPALTSFGIVMAMTVGLAGWGTVTLILAIINPSIWKSNIRGWAWSLFTLGIDELPLLGTIPMLTITHARLYAGQIRHDKAAIEKYKKQQEQVAAAARLAQQRRALERIQARDAQIEQAEQEESDDEIPDGAFEAA